MYNNYSKFGKHNNYNRSNFDNRNNKEEEEEKVIVTEDTKTEDVVEITETVNQEENITLESEELSQEEISELTKNDVIDVQNVEDITEGIVFDCNKLNVRKQASKDSEVIEIIDINSEVLIDLALSTNDFYKVRTMSGKEGYCLKTFIKIK